MLIKFTMEFIDLNYWNMYQNLNRQYSPPFFFRGVKGSQNLWHIYTLMFPPLLIHSIKDWGRLNTQKCVCSMLRIWFGHPTLKKFLVWISHIHCTFMFVCYVYETRLAWCTSLTNDREMCFIQHTLIIVESKSTIGHTVGIPFWQSQSSLILTEKGDPWITAFFFYKDHYARY